MASKSSSELSYDTKTIVVILTLIFVYPIGALLMYRWMNWPKWVKVVIALPIIFFAIAIIITTVVWFLTLIHP